MTTAAFLQTWDDDDDEQALFDEEEFHVRERAKATLLAWFHARTCTPSQGCSCDLAVEEYASMPTAGLLAAADSTLGLDT